MVIPSKLTGEVVTVSFHFLDELDWGETISFARVAPEVFSGDDSMPQALIMMPPVIAGSFVRQKVANGLPGVIYLLRAIITTSTGRTVEKQVKLAVLPIGHEIGYPDAQYQVSTSRPYPIIVGDAFSAEPEILEGELRTFVKEIVLGAPHESIYAVPEIIGGELKEPYNLYQCRE